MVATQAEIVAALGMILDKDEYVQRIKDYNAAVTAAQAAAYPNLIPTFMAAGASTKGLPTVYINGYTAPN